MKDDRGAPRARCCALWAGVRARRHAPPTVLGRRAPAAMRSRRRDRAFVARPSAAVARVIVRLTRRADPAPRSRRAARPSGLVTCLGFAARACSSTSSDAPPAAYAALAVRDRAEPSASSTPASASCCCAAWTRSRASARRCRSRPRCSCSTTRPRTARRRRRARTRPSTRSSRSTGGAARPRTTRRCSSARAGRYALLLNEDSELRPGATAALHAALEARPAGRRGGRAAAAPRRRAAAVGVALPDRRRRRSAAALLLHRRNVQSTGDAMRDGRLGAVGRAARPPRGGRADRLARPSVLRLLRRGRLRQAAARRGLARRSTCPDAVAVHHEQLSTGGVPERRIVEFARNRDRYMRKHHGAARGARRALADRAGPTRCARSPRSSCPATTRAGTRATSPRRCGPAAARASARRPRRSTPRATQQHRRARPLAPPSGSA